MSGSSGFNIDSSIVMRAQEQGLEIISTGGGYDFVSVMASPVCETSTPRPRFILTDPYSDEGPKDLAARANVVVFPDDDWRSLIEFSFTSAATAMNALSNPDFRASALWFLVQAVDAKEADSFIDAFIAFSGKTQLMIRSQNLTFQQAAEAVLLWHEATLVAIQKSGEPGASTVALH